MRYHTSLAFGTECTLPNEDLCFPEYECLDGDADDPGYKCGMKYVNIAPTQYPRSYVRHDTTSVPEKPPNIPFYAIDAYQQVGYGIAHSYDILAFFG